MASLDQSVPRYSGENFCLWCENMKAFMQSKDLWEFIENECKEGSVSAPEGEEKLKENQRKNAEALSYIQQALPDDILLKIMSVSKAKEAWEILVKDYQVEQNHGSSITQQVQESQESQQIKVAPQQGHEDLSSQACGNLLEIASRSPNTGVHGEIVPFSSQPTDYVGGLLSKFGVGELMQTVGAGQVMQSPKPNMGNIDMAIYQALPNSGPLVGPDFVVQYPLALKIVRKAFTLTGGNFEVTDMIGNSFFMVKGKLLTLHDQRTLLDVSGNPLVTYRSKTLSLHDTWYAYKGDSKKSEDLFFTAKKSSMFQLKTTLDVFLAGNNKGSCDFKVKGGWLEQSFTVYSGETDIVVAQMQKEYSIQSVVFDQDSYILDVYPNIDYAFIVSLLVIFDGISAGDTDVSGLKKFL